MLKRSQNHAVAISECHAKNVYDALRSNVFHACDDTKADDVNEGVVDEHIGLPSSSVKAGTTSPQRLSTETVVPSITKSQTEGGFDGSCIRSSHTPKQE